VEHGLFSAGHAGPCVIPTVEVCRPRNIRSLSRPVTKYPVVFVGGFTFWIISFLIVAKADRLLKTSEPARTFEFRGSGGSPAESPEPAK